jgi:hypothetical protein
MINLCIIRTAVGTRISHRWGLKTIYPFLFNHLDQKTIGVPHHLIHAHNHYTCPNRFNSRSWVILWRCRRHGRRRVSVILCYEWLYLSHEPRVAMIPTLVPFQFPISATHLRASPTSLQPRGSSFGAVEHVNHSTWPDLEGV